MPSERPVQRLADTIENIDRIRSYVAGLNYDAYVDTPLVQDAVERCFARISEAAVKLGERMDLRYPAVPWIDIRSLGNRLRHAYDDVDSRRACSPTELPLQGIAVPECAASGGSLSVQQRIELGQNLIHHNLRQHAYPGCSPRVPVDTSCLIGQNSTRNVQSFW